MESDSELFAMPDTHESQAHTINGHISAVETLLRIFREWRFLATPFKQKRYYFLTAFLHLSLIVFSELSVVRSTSSRVSG